MRFRRGHIYAVTFDDHVEDGDEPIRFVVYGLVIGAAIVIIEAIIAGSYDSQGGT